VGRVRPASGLLHKQKDSVTHKKAGPQRVHPLPGPKKLVGMTFFWGGLGCREHCLLERYCLLFYP
jgi:hypothetical protein